MQRGRYGLEFDEEETFSFRKLGWLLVAIPCAAGAVFFFRGCSHRETPAEIASADLRLTEPEEKPRPAQRQIARPETSRHEQQVRKPQESLSPKKSEYSGNVQKLLDDVQQCERTDDLLGAQKLLLQLLAEKDAAPIADFVEKKLASANWTLLFGNREMEGKIKHKVAPGDLIGRIARQYNNTQEFVLKANNISNPSGLRIGQELWVLNKPVFGLSVHKKSCTAVLTLNGKFFKRYTVGVGPAKDLPSGTYSVARRVQKPRYRRAGQKPVPYGASGNILGTVWLGLSSGKDVDKDMGIGLHGTWVNASLGRENDDGFVRFANPDIEQLALLLPIGTRVDIVE